jgi:hypothetical protein
VRRKSDANSIYNIGIVQRSVVRQRYFSLFCQFRESSSSHGAL